MIWEAILNDNTRVLEYNNGKEVNFNDLDKSKVKQFGIIDSNQLIANLDISNGDFEINNLDLTELNKLTGNEKIELSYNADLQRFIISKESLVFLNSLLLKNDRVNRIYFDENGVFYINGINLYIGFNDTKFINSPPKDIIHLKGAVTDFIGSRESANPYKRIDSVLSYTIGYTNIYTINSIVFTLSLKLIYDVIQKSVSLECIIESSENVDGELFIIFGENKSSLRVSLDKGQKAKLDRIITLM